MAQNYVITKALRARLADVEVKEKAWVECDGTAWFTPNYETAMALEAESDRLYREYWNAVEELATMIAKHTGMEKYEARNLVNLRRAKLRMLLNL